jgi:hypothetical protein
MRKQFYYIALLTFIFGMMTSCSSSKKTDNTAKGENEMAATGKMTVTGPPVIIYKTKADYYDMVPVTLSEDKSKIVSYPGARDLYKGDELALPTHLHNGYLLDNRGIDQNVAFLNISYEKFTKMQRVFTAGQLYEMILDKDPLTEMYNCGKKSKFKNEVSELNEIIDKGSFEECQTLK